MLDRDALQSVVDKMMRQGIRGRCNTRFHSGIKEKMAHTTWREATSWMRQEAAKERNIPSPEDALERCREMFGNIPNCDTCTSALQEAFDELK